MGGDAGLEVVFPWWFISESPFYSRLLRRRGNCGDGRNTQMVSRLAGTAEENHRVLLCHALDCHTEGMNRPALLKKGPTPDDLCHISSRETVRQPQTPSPNIQLTAGGHRTGTEENQNSGHGCRRRSIAVWRRNETPLLDRTTSLAHPRSGFQKGDLPAGKTTVMDKFVTDRAARPASAKHGFVPIEIFSAHSA